MYKDKSFKHVCSRVHPPILYPLYHINRCPNIYSEITAEPADIDLCEYRATNFICYKY